MNARQQAIEYVTDQIRLLDGCTGKRATARRRTLVRRLAQLTN